MDIEVKRLFKEAQKNEEFNKKIKKDVPENYKKIHWYSDDVVKHLYASCYYGWLAGRGEYKKSNYYY